MSSVKEIKQNLKTVLENNYGKPASLKKHFKKMASYNKEQELFEHAEKLNDAEITYSSAKNASSHFYVSVNTAEEGLHYKTFVLDIDSLTPKGAKLNRKGGLEFLYG